MCVEIPLDKSIFLEFELHIPVQSVSKALGDLQRMNNFNRSSNNSTQLPLYLHNRHNTNPQLQGLWR